MNRRYRVWFGMLLLSMTLLFGGCTTQKQTEETTVAATETATEAVQTTQESVETSAAAKKKLTMHYIDVGQGHATLVESNGHFMLMDGGDAGASSKVVSYLKKQGVKKLDYVIASHYDADHLNGVVGALHAFRVSHVIGPDYQTDTRVYQSFVSILKEKGLKRIHPKVGKTCQIGKARFTILAPNDTHYSEANDYSVAIRIVNGKNSFLITGDAEIESEYEMLENGKTLKSDVYLVAHHGSSGASSQAFLQAVKPKYAVISVGSENKYGHPAAQTMSRLKAAGCKVFRTDEQGTILAISNGSRITFNHKPSTTWAYRNFGSSESVGGKGNQPKQTAAPATSGKFIGNRNTKKFHLSNCRYLPDQKNQVRFKSVKAAENAGYTPCGICHPDR